MPTVSHVMHVVEAQLLAGLLGCLVPGCGGVLAPWWYGVERPLVMAGGKKLPERDSLIMAYHAVENGAAGVDMGRNIFQSDTPQAMIRAVGAVVHESMKPEDAYDQFVQQPAPAG